MNLNEELETLIRSGVHRIGEVEILTDRGTANFVLCHYRDKERAGHDHHDGLEIHHKPDAARDISTWSEDGGYRFAKAMTNLKTGWVLLLDDIGQVRMALDLLYPASLGLEIARRNGTLEVEHLRDKLNRQTGMYRFARNISDDGAQDLIRKVCGPAHQCARRILWQLDEGTPLVDSEASRYNGIPAELPESEAIPLLCREACNHFVAECRKASKAEFEARNPDNTGSTGC